MPVKVKSEIILHVDMHCSESDVLLSRKYPKQIFDSKIAPDDLWTSQIFGGEHASQTPLVAACFRTFSFRVRRYYHLNLTEVLATALIKDAATDRSAVTWITHTLANKYIWAIAFWHGIFMLLTVGWNQVVPHTDRLQ